MALVSVIVASGEYAYAIPVLFPARVTFGHVTVKLVDVTGIVLFAIVNAAGAVNTDRIFENTGAFVLTIALAEISY